MVLFLFATNSQIAWWVDNISSLHIYVCVHTHTHTHTHKMCMCVLSCFSHVQLFATLCFSVHGILPGKNIGVGCHFLLQGIFPNQGSNRHLLCLLHWQKGSLRLAPVIYFIYSSIYLWRRRWQPHSSVLAWGTPGTGAWWAAIYGRTESDTTGAT